MSDLNVDLADEAVSDCEVAVKAKPEYQMTAEYREFYNNALKLVAKSGRGAGKRRRRLQKIKPIQPPLQEAPAP